MKAILNLVFVASSLLPQVAQADTDSAGHDPVLTTIKNTPDLSIFYSLFASTGGSSGLPAPAFEERFNDLNQGLNYTVLAPTNKAFSNINPNDLAILKSSPVYSLLESLLLNLIFPDDVLTANSSTVEAIGGFSYTFSPQGEINTNENVKSSEVSIPAQAKFLRGSDGKEARIHAGNGVVYKIDKFVDSYLTYFGVQKPTELSNLPQAEDRSGSMGDIIRNDNDYSDLYAILNSTLPDFLDQLDQAPNARKASNTTVYLAPINSAFDALSSEADPKAVQPSNADLTRFLLTAGYGQLAHDATNVMSGNGLSIDLSSGKANNARVESRICGSNGCVWKVGRWIDPAYSVFDIQN